MAEEIVIQKSDPLPIKKKSAKVCRYFKKGFCGYGEKCLYNHSLPKRSFPSNNPSDVQNCPFYKRASCKFASKCWYKHIRPKGKVYPKPEPLNQFIVVGPARKEPQKTEDMPATVEDSSLAMPAQETKTHRHFKRPQNQQVVPKNCFCYEKCVVIMDE
ncbi:putative E3 ubiquitin-protein ligase like protein [Argiope bruennichi]|uniref:RING-type E3 ubiquitin transferase n=1 Tax=Argiope bruennichi TaxID=94029 RepID=A0A8T0EHC5_ARGBR|nr:putative E3 ubiquitin-protein ligase like protein [Argiope bruennichi]